VGSTREAAQPASTAKQPRTQRERIMAWSEEEIAA
jgi:hypothetical protein